MGLLSRKAQLQQVSWQVMEDLAFYSERWPRLSKLAAQVLFDLDQQSCTCQSIKGWNTAVLLIDLCSRQGRNA
jgi:hypothetical protein